MSLENRVSELKGFIGGITYDLDDSDEVQVPAALLKKFAYVLEDIVVTIDMLSDEIEEFKCKCKGECKSGD